METTLLSYQNKDGFLRGYNLVKDAFARDMQKTQVDTLLHHSETIIDILCSKML